MTTAAEIARPREAVVDPDLAIVDAHHHLWDHMEWRPGSGYPSRYVPGDFAADIEGHKVVSTVYIECHVGYRKDGPDHLKPVGETEYAAAIAQAQAGAATRMCAAIVGAADLDLGSRVGEVLDAHLEAGRGYFRGIRSRVNNGDDESLGPMLKSGPLGMLVTPAHVEGARELVKRGLTLDVWLFQNQLDDVARLADQLPDLPIVLNHIGGYMGAGRFAETPRETFAAWAAGLKDVARRPNITLKVGGMGMTLISPELIAAGGDASSDVLVKVWRPLVETCIDTFGPDRCLMESNFPVDGLTCGYRELWNALKRLTQGYSSGERADMFGGVARRVYQIAD